MLVQEYVVVRVLQLAVYRQITFAFKMTVDNQYSSCFRCNGGTILTPLIVTKLCFFEALKKIVPGNTCMRNRSLPRQ